ncbi:GRAS transcription factor [Trema orientale]|uniref:GRAS transcription factor n=1 Tax=Trema orientale TaxID=63057 RepID=A0A2P5EXI8_TREOI|nr:GRAS transcription factor [Trema orientale]
MQTSQKHQRTGVIHGLYHQPMQEIDSYRMPHFQIVENNMFQDIGSQGKTVSFETCNGQFFTLDSSPATTDFLTCDSPSAVSVLSNRSTFSPQGSHTCSSDPHHSPDIYSGSPISGCSVADDGSDLKHKLREIEISLLGIESEIVDSCYCCYKTEARQNTSMATWKMLDSKLDLKQVLVECARAVSESDITRAVDLMEVLGNMVSVSGEPIQRLGAYLLEGLRARLEKSGSSIYKALKCSEPITSSELLSYMSILYQICPFWRFAYISANVVIREAIQYEQRIHIIDFQIAQGSQWMALFEDLARRPGGPPFVRITGVDDSQSAFARGGGLDLVGKRLSKQAELLNVPFEFHGAAMCGSEVKLETLRIRPGEAIVVNCPYVLHHMADESVSTENHRDRLLRLIKSLSPKVMTLVEQESNTNTSPFFARFRETLDYYTAMFESIDVARPRDDKQRISAEQHCVARDIVNMIACEGPDRVERHELFTKWRARLMMAGLTPYPLSSSVTCAVNDLLREYNQNFRIGEMNGALYLGWKNRLMATSSAWR